MKLRLRYCKFGKVRFVSHRDGARLWERALRRVNFPVAYTESFTPRPKLSFGLALPTGAESAAEFIDVDLAAGMAVDVDDPGVIHDLCSALPTGIDVHVLAVRDGIRGSQQTEVTAMTWELSGPGIEPDRLERAPARLPAAEELPVARQRKGRRHVDDVHPLIIDLCPDPSGTKLVADLSAVGRSLRPSELAAVECSGIETVNLRVLRTHQWIDDDGDRRELLSRPVGATALDESLSA